MSIKIQKESKKKKKKTETLIRSYLSCVPFINTHWLGGCLTGALKPRRWIIIVARDPYFDTMTKSRNKRDSDTTAWKSKGLIT